MGRGNWMPNNPARHHNPDTFRSQLYVEIIDLDEDTHEDYLVEEAQDTLKEVLREALPDSFREVSAYEDSNWFGVGFAVDTQALFANRHVIVAWDTRGETWHQGVGVVVNPDAYQDKYGGLAERSAEAISKKITEALLDAYPGKVSVRTSPWTSAKLKAA